MSTTHPEFPGLVNEVDPHCEQAIIFLLSTLDPYVFPFYPSAEAFPFLLYSCLIFFIWVTP